ncbi:nitroreductase family deazaflavin-dependent oxidoreductase [Nonomuraea sp. ZG12]|uniref:nitroreductase family deazaflavin-dependent oxidoreductase n=1 Tax=Nonomuraea sp. ZG12 TaxID=3452207 RepID=UPI003F8B53A4
MSSMWPQIARPDAGTVLVTESSSAAAWEGTPWPTGLLSVTEFAATDGGAVLTYTQWASGAADRAFVAGLTGAEPVEYELYRSGEREDRPTPGCLVAVRVEFDGPDRERQRQWIDTVFQALASEAEPHPGGISGHFHVSADGTRVLNYAEWTDERAHRDAIASSGQGAVGGSADWRRVQRFPGVKNSQVRRYHLLRSLPTPAEDAPPTSRPAAGGAAEEVLDSPTGWVAEHIRTYLDSDGRDGHLYQGLPTLLLTTRGRKSGRLRRTALIYGRDGDRHLLVASNGGSPQHPAWYLNLSANPGVTVQVGGDIFDARARVATPEEKRRLWRVMAEVFPLYDTYQEGTERDLPLVILERA